VELDIDFHYAVNSCSNDLTLCIIFVIITYMKA